MCSASRAVAALAEARARAAALARSREERESLLGGATVRAILGALEDRMLAIARGDASASPGGGGGSSGAAAPPAAHLRQLALSALLWFQVLPAADGSTAAAPPARLPPARVTEWLSSGGGSVASAVRGIFADPWPEDCLAAFVHQLHRRLVATPTAAPYLLACASAAASAAPSRVKHDQLHAMWDFCLRQQQGGTGEAAVAAVRAALARLSAPLPAVAQPPSAAAPEVKAFAAREEVGHWALARSAAWWLGENANYACGEFAWAPRRVPEELADALAEWGGGGRAAGKKTSKKKKKRGRDADSSSSDSSSSSDDDDHDDDLGHGRRSNNPRRSRNHRNHRAPVLPAGPELLAAAAASTNPLLTVVIAHLQRALVAGSWEVRVAAAQALAKVGVRSGEPFRVQCYALLSGAAPAARAGLAAPGAAATATTTTANGNSANAQQQKDAAIGAPALSLAQQQHHHRGADPLGVAAAVAPALEVLDALYSAEVVVEALARQFGRRRRAWPRSALASLQRRNKALLAAVLERVCFVPQDSYWPLGALARDVLKGCWDDEESTDEGEDARAEEVGGVEGEGEGGEGEGGEEAEGGEVIIATGEGVEEQLEAERQRLAQLELEKKRKEEEEAKAKAAEAEEEEEARRQAAAEADEDEQEARRRGGAYADSDDSDAPPAARQRAAAADRLAGQLQGYDYDPNAAFDEADAALQQAAQQQRAAAASAAASSSFLRGTALYDFSPEDDDEVAVAEGEKLRVEWEQGGWMQVVRESDGVAGLVPSSYVRLEEGGEGGGGGAGADDEDLLIGDDDDSDVAAARLGRAAARRVSQEYLQRRGSGGLGGGSYESPRGGGGFQLRRATAATTAGGAAAYGGYSSSSAAAAAEAEDDRLGEREDRDSGAVDIAMAVGRLGNESAELGRAEGRLEELEQAGAGGAANNLPQLMALHEAIEACVGRMDALQGPLGTDGRAMRRRLRARGGEMLARVGALRGGGAGATTAGGGAASPLAGVTPRGGPGSVAGAGYFGGAEASPRAEAAAGAASSTAAVVAYAFSAEADGELSVAAGDRVVVEAEVDGWYSVVRESDGARGLVPASYVELG
jgi:hypothetical protein